MHTDTGAGPSHSGEMLPPQAAHVSQADFRRAMGRFATGITIATAAYDGIDHAMTANAFTSVSLDPPLVALCVSRSTRFHDAAAWEGAGWAVSILSADAVDAAVWFATKGRPLDGQLDRFAHTRGPHTGAALFVGALSTLECRTTAVHPGGDHDIVLGTVLAAQAEDAVTSDPLLYFYGGYRHLGADSAAPPT